MRHRGNDKVILRGHKWQGGTKLGFNTGVETTL